MTVEYRVYCAQCGWECGSMMHYCPNCGKRLDLSVPPRPSCPNCGRPVREQDAFCSGCGTSLSSSDQEMPRYCQNCGTQLWGKATFCMCCGRPVTAADDDREITIYGMPPIRDNDSTPDSSGGDTSAEDDFRNMRVVYGMPPWLRGR